MFLKHPLWNSTEAKSDLLSEQLKNEISYKSELTIYELRRANSKRPRLANLIGQLISIRLILKNYYEKKKSAREKLLKILKCIGKHPAVHGIVSIANDNISTPFKVMWIIFLITSWSISFSIINNLTLNYYKYPVKSNFLISYEPKRVFPAVTICNLCPYDGAFSFYDIQAVENLNNISAANSINLLSYIDKMNDLIKVKYENMKQTDPSFDIARQSFYLSQMLVSCEFNGITCNESDFYWFHDYNYGNCFRFNGQDPDQNSISDESSYKSRKSLRTQVKPGWESGLRLELYSGTQPIQQQYLYKIGFRVIIHNQTVRPFPDEDGIDVPAGKVTSIAMSRHFVNRLPKPYSNCILNLDAETSQQNDILRIVYDKIQSNQLYKYQQNICLKVCNSIYFTRKCNCTSYNFAFLEYTSNSSYCRTLSEIECMERADVDFLNGKEIENCYSACPIECAVVNYGLDISWASYPSLSYVNGIYNKSSYFGYDNFFYDQTYTYDGPTYDIIKKSTAMINVYYSTLRYRVLQETPLITFETLISNIGSCLALFAGASLLTPIILIELFLSLIINFLESKKIIR